MAVDAVAVGPTVVARVGHGHELGHHALRKSSSVDLLSLFVGAGVTGMVDLALLNQLVTCLVGACRLQVGIRKKDRMTGDRTHGRRTWRGSGA